MPSFNGVPIFGGQVKMATDEIERETQFNSFAGIDGVEVLDMGFRGMRTTARGRLFGLGRDGGFADLLAAIQTFRSYRDGRSYVLVNTSDESFENVRLESFKLDEEGGIRQTPMGDFFQLYTATFTHLTRS